MVLGKGKRDADPDETIILDDEDIEQLDALTLTSVIDEVTGTLVPEDGDDEEDSEDDSASPFDDLDLGVLDYGDD